MEAASIVTVDNSLSIGEKIIYDMKERNVAEYTFKKANQSVTMLSRNAVVIDGESVSIDPQLLFQRLILLVGNMDESQVEDVFRFKLSHRPASIFDEKGFMRSGENASLDTAMHKIVANEPIGSIDIVGKNIFSGEYLMNKIEWKKSQTYDDILNAYLVFVQQHNYPTVVFDTYVSEPSIHDEYYLRKGVSGVKVAFTGGMQFSSKKEPFLLNMFNKRRFAAMLCDRLVEHGCAVLKSTNNLHLTISRLAMQYAEQNDTVITSDDSDLLHILCSEFKSGLKNVFFKLDRKGTKNQTLWNIQEIQSVLGIEAMKYLPFVNAIAGYKTTSHMFGIGKGNALKKLIKSEGFRNAAKVFTSPQSEISEIIEAGKTAIVMLYNGRKGQSLNELRYTRFADKFLSAKSCIEVQTLPMTDSSAYYHSLRVYLQTQIWMGNETLDALQYGLKCVNNKLVPKTTDLPIAPKELLSSIRCGCKGDCATKKCACKKNSMSCSVACTICRGVCCLNPSTILEEEEEEVEENYY